MEETYLVLMLKDKETGFLDKELSAYKIGDNEDLIVNIFVTEEEDDKLIVHLKITTDKDCEDWEFDAIYDYYDNAIYDGLILSFSEETEVYNPTFLLTFEYNDNDSEMENFIRKILALHKNELNDVYEAIKDKEEDYKCELN